MCEGDTQIQSFHLQGRWSKSNEVATIRITVPLYAIQSVHLTSQKLNVSNKITQEQKVIHTLPSKHRRQISFYLVFVILHSSRLVSNLSSQKLLKEHTTEYFLGIEKKKIVYQFYF